MHGVSAPSLASTCPHELPVSAPAGQSRQPSVRGKSLPSPRAPHAGDSRPTWATPVIATEPAKDLSRDAVRFVRSIVVMVIAIGGISLTGCQVDVGGQTLPSGYYLQLTASLVSAQPLADSSRFRMISWE